MKSKGRFRLFSLTGILLLLGALAVGITHGTAARAASVSTGLHVVGNKIEDGSGHVITPHGAARMGTEYSCLSGNTFDGPVDQTAVSAMLTWNIHIVRIPMNEDCWLGINGLPSGNLSSSTYQQNIVNYVNLLNQNGMMVILDLHWSNYGGNKATGQNNMADRDHSLAFWTSVANRFKGNSSAIFDLYNEPHDISWTCWRDGSSSAYANPCSTMPFAVAGMQTLINTVRATGATNILMLGGLGWAGDVSSWLAYKPSDPLNNLTASIHIYGGGRCSDMNCLNTYVAAIAAKYPVITGELGEFDCPSSAQITVLMNWFDQHGIGYLAWAWATYACPSLITNYNGTPTGYGQGFKNHMLTLGSGISGGGGSTPTPTPTPGSGGGTYYKLVNRNSGQALDISGASTANGGVAIQWPYSSTYNQQWKEVSTNGGYKLVNRNSGLLLDDPGYTKTAGTQIDQWSDSNGNNQWWNLVSAGNGYYYIVNQYSGLYVDVSGASTANGATVDLWTSTGGTNQQWQLVAV
jgi:Cellulase (glycosyl hydrolase family 5)/Ricin-type beta-trefoil lectin domain-like